MIFTQAYVDSVKNKAKCCFVNFAYLMYQYRSSGDTPNYKCLRGKSQLVYAYLKSLCGYKVVGEQLTPGQYAKWELYIDDPRIGSRIDITINGTQYSYIFATDDPLNAVQQLFVYMQSQNFGGYVNTNYPYMAIFAPEVGSQYNGDEFTIAYAYDYEIVGQTGIVSGVKSGVYQYGSDPTYQTQTTLTNEQAENVINNINSICNCSC